MTVHMQGLKRPKRTRASSPIRPLLPLLAALMAIILLWETPLVYPLRILVVFFHELSHGLAAIATGGRIIEIQLYPGEGGLCVTQGGWYLAIVSAGYLGSLAWGGGLLVLTARLRDARWLLGALALLLIGVTVFFVRPLIGFGLFFGIATGAVLLVMALYAPAWASRFTLQVIGLTSVLYAPLDILEDVIFRPHLPSDAVLLAEATWIPAVVWGVLWIIIALAAAALFLRLAVRR